MPITKRDADGLEPGSAVWDEGKGAVAGFGVRRQRDARVFVVKYRFAGKQRWRGGFGNLNRSVEWSFRL
ncbi:MAG: hypothetical protein OEL76_17730 [Siculibacillus sp.]|nr:hypothetical protein [Siculibacillus sp.]